MSKEQKTKEVTVKVPYNYDWDEELLRFREHIEEPTDNADLTNAKVGDIYQTNFNEKAVLISTRGLYGDYRYIFILTSKGGDRTYCSDKNGFCASHIKNYYIKELTPKSIKNEKV